jgi:hypothetical protein
MNIRPVRHPLGDGVGPEAAALDVHVVRLLGLALGREVHEDRGRVQLEGLEDVRALVKVHHGEEERVGVELGVAVGIRHNVKLIAVFRKLNSLPANSSFLRTTHEELAAFYDIFAGKMIKKCVNIITKFTKKNHGVCR